MSASTPTTVPDPNDPDTLHVAVAAIVDNMQRVLLARRPDHVHQGGLWEFPGGKRESGESIGAALEREIQEELGIRISSCRPLICIPHRYEDRSVLLDVWRVESFEGKPHGREGQPLEWVPINALDERAFPAANLPIIRALQLPTEYLITPDPGTDHEAFLVHLQRRLDDGIRLVQLRAKGLDDSSFRTLAERVITQCQSSGARILLNADVALAVQLGADGIQLGSQRLRQAGERTLPENLLLGASCHTTEELAHAHASRADFALLSPVKPTASHPDAPALGWPAFAQQVAACVMPVYALGGMTPTDLEEAIVRGGQGIAAIRALWEV
ncbi:Mutator MutT protein (7,8-dihydro-8-oxoguanine-triphosphatase) / Thiazole tautomerase TenI-like domain [hydrothermal vent metagenome]|uniref:8-oxo-dGTP diphosphatase n=1 Tax=hydrothermal vent metagenome TaxID=652676 RepID=A0A3B0YID3_9ZZZZ